MAGERIYIQFSPPELSYTISPISKSWFVSLKLVIPRDQVGPLSDHSTEMEKKATDIKTEIREISTMI
jgi:hypothetical protein